MPSTLVALRIASAPISMARRARRRIGGEVGIAGAGGKNDHAPLFEMADCPAANERFGDFLHFDRRLDAGEDAPFFERILQRQRIDDRGQHPHVIAADTVHSGGADGDAADDIAAADRCGHLDARSRGFPRFPRRYGRPCRGSTPKPWAPMRASPLSLSNTRLIRGLWPRR